MSLRILLVVPRNCTGTQLQKLIKTFPIVEGVDMVATEDEMKNYLGTCYVDFVIIHQALVQDFTLLPHNHYLVIADKIDKQILLAVRDHGGRGYLLEKGAQEMMQSIITIAIGKEEAMFLLGPYLSFEVLKALDDDKFLAPSTPVHLNKLTPQQKQVFYLLHEGHSNLEIAERLCISCGSVRSYISRIVHKLGITHEQIQHLQLPEDK
ncbi:MAG TPA: LuxR C-terminal-related transcriptional regulator [Ktedonobacteraceae bacterium]|nr:LuxR C-terminal-related transcriptional regulator [Ktedonobacteraceae bacterium]